MMRSSKPSPFTSPAESTDTPLWSLGASPGTRKPLVPSSVGDVELGRKSVDVAEHHIACAALIAAPADVIVGCADDDVVEAVAVHVAGRGDRHAAILVQPVDVDLKAVGAIQGGKLDHLIETGHTSPLDGRGESRAEIAARS